ncbi:hypothetical protein AVEN_53163-1 [Araneus ventricosus]|uniref:Uncharacterized protein n=1 Tax=Araneus ventricosus TaxID=182803 RepID=A0A4Y2A9A0_ARAVE|nr:hypothetical protein AVEN_53163-1 [Araneus ventricosus]
MKRTTPKLALLPLHTSSPHQGEDIWSPPYDLKCNSPIYTTYLQWHRVSHLEPSGQEAEILPLGHRGHLNIIIVYLLNEFKSTGLSVSEP